LKTDNNCLSTRS